MSPDSGGEPWQEFVSPHFRVLSDLPTDEGEATTREIEQGLDALVNVAFPNARQTIDRTTVVVFRNRSELRAFLPELAGGRYWQKLPNDLEPTPFLLIAEGLRPSTRIMFYHELTHDLFARNFGWSPPWLSEGWAQYYSTLRIENGKAILGGALPHIALSDTSDFYVGRKEDGELAYAIPPSRVRPPTELMAMDARTYYAWTRHGEDTPSDREMAASLYFGSWALVHMMLDGGEPYTPRFQRFLSEVSADRRLEQAWNRAFSDLPGERIDRDFRDYLRRAQLAVWKSSYVPSSSAVGVTRRTMTDSEVRLLWARLERWNRPEAETTVAPELEQLIVRAPDAPEPHYWRGVYAMVRGDSDRAEKEFGHVIALLPNDPRPWLAKILLRAPPGTKIDLGSSPELITAAERLATLANSATQLRIVAAIYRALRRTERGFELASRAASLAPIDPLVLDTYAALLFDRGNIAEAVSAQRRAVACLPDRTEASELFEHLKQYEAEARRSK